MPACLPPAATAGFRVQGPGGAVRSVGVALSSGWMHSLAACVPAGKRSMMNRRTGPVRHCQASEEPALMSNLPCRKYEIPKEPPTTMVIMGRPTLRKDCDPRAITR